MKSISDIFWNLPLNDSSTILFKWMKHLHNEKKKIPKPTTQEKEIEGIFNRAKIYDATLSGLVLYVANPKEIGYISNNLHFLIPRYDGLKKQEYQERLKLLDSRKESYNDPLIIFHMAQILN